MPVGPKAGVRFAASTTQPAKWARSGLSPLTDQCASLVSSASSTSLLGFIQGEDQGKLILHSDTSVQLPSKSDIESLEDFLSTTRHRFVRVRVGLGVVVNLLSLDSSIWVPLDLDKTKIWVIKELDTSNSTPYLFHPGRYFTESHMPGENSTMPPRPWNSSFGTSLRPDSRATT